MKHKCEFCEMQILLVAATLMEIAPFLEQRPMADHLITGVGSPFAIFHLVQRLHQIDYDLVVQAGIAGCFSRSQSLGEVVAVSKDNFADIGMVEKHVFKTVFETGFVSPDEYPFSNGWLLNNGSLLEALDMKKVNAITVNTITDDRDRIDQLIAKYDPQIETMEGAASHYVCLQNDIPFLQLRGISNYVGERDKLKWDLEGSVKNLNNELMALFNRLSA